MKGSAEIEAQLLIVTQSYSYTVIELHSYRVTQLLTVIVRRTAGK